jgi:hypothetical protein
MSRDGTPETGQAVLARHSALVEHEVEPLVCEAARQSVAWASGEGSVAEIVAQLLSNQIRNVPWLAQLEMSPSGFA